MVESLAAGLADYALGAVAVIGPIVQAIPGGGLLGRLLTANTQPLLDKAVSRATGGQFSVAGLMTGTIRVVSAYAEDSLTNSTKAVSRLKARADMGETVPAVSWLVRKLRGGGTEPEG